MGYKRIILDYEKRLNLMKQELDSLIMDDELDASKEILKNKLGLLENELEYLNKQIEAVKRIAQIEDREGIEAKAVTEPGPQQPVPLPQQPVPLPQPPAAKKKDIEKTIGKSWMAIFASLLIFVSIVMFAMVVIPKLNETAKMIIMYIVSGAITTFGIVKLRKKINRSMWVSVSACGMGAIFISLMLTRMYFEAIGDEALYVMILVWSVGICAMSAFHTYVYQIIGQIGILVAIIFGLGYSISVENMNQFIMVVIFYGITQIVFYAVNCKNHMPNNIVSHAAVIIGAFSIIFAASDMDAYIAELIVLIFLTAYMCVCLIKNRDAKENKAVIGAIFIPISLAIMIAGNNMEGMIHDSSEIVYFSICYVSYLLILGLMHVLKYNGIEKNIIQIASVVCVTIFAIENTEQIECICVIAIVCIAAAAALKDSVYQYAAGVLSIIYLLCLIFDTNGINMILASAAIILLTGTLFVNYRSGLKGIVLAGIYIYLVSAVNYFVDMIFYEVSMPEERYALWFCISATINMIVMKTGASLNWRTKEEEKGFRRYINILNSIFVVCALSAIMDESELHLLVIMVSVAVYFMNAGRLLAHKKFIVNMYVGFKFSVLLVVILTSLDVMGIIISIACLLLAIVFVWAGFVLEKKALRVYGLVLANLSVIKLILYDLSYDNYLKKALSFFLCGILCFTISFIYNKIESRKEIR